MDRRDLRQEGEWLIFCRSVGTPTWGRDVAILVCRGCPDAYQAGGRFVPDPVGYRDGVSFGFLVGDGPIMTAKREEKAIWNWGDEAPLETHPVTREEKRIVARGDAETLPVSDLVRTFLKNTSLSVSEPTSTSGPQ